MQINSNKPFIPTNHFTPQSSNVTVPYQPINHTNQMYPLQQTQSPLNQRPFITPPQFQNPPLGQSTQNSFSNVQYQNMKAHNNFQSQPNTYPAYLQQSSNQNQTKNQSQMNAIVNGMNNSSIRQMSKGQNIKLFDIMALLSQTITDVNRFSMLRQAKSQDLKHYFRIVQIDEDELFDKGLSSTISGSSFCSKISSERNKYQMLITLDGKQLKFQSMTDRKLHYNVNFDTICCEFIQYVQGDNEYMIKFRVGDKIITIFINQTSLLYHLRKQKQDSPLAKEYIERSAKQIAKYLKKAIEKSRGYQFKLFRLIQKDEDFFMKNYATEEQFTKYCETGDILLFKDQHTFAKIQRVITNSQYDHIAFVYRHQKYGICLIEASSGFGVALTVWTHLIRRHWFKGIDSISWRRLLMHNKPNNFEQTVKQFVDVNLHKKYGISVQKLLTFKSKIKGKQEQKDRTYFCSELVAQLYKQLGLLDSKVSSSQYWPKHFSQKGYIAMLNNSALDKERILLFNEQIIKDNYKGYQQCGFVE